MISTNFEVRDTKQISNSKFQFSKPSLKFVNVSNFGFRISNLFLKGGA